MAKLEWDVTGKRKLQAGVSKTVLYPMDGSTYGDGVAWSGVTAINENPAGADLTDLYADNIKYASMRAAETFGFGIEAYDYPDEWAECDGSATPTTGVALGQQTRKAFGLCYRTEIGDDAHPGMDAGYQLHFVYNSTASPSGRGYATINNSPNAITMSWDASSTPENVQGTSYKPVCTVVVDSTKVDAAKLTAFEETIYGNANAAAKMPLPHQIIAAFASTSGGETPPADGNTEEPAG